MSSPIEHAKAATPFWMMEIQKFDAIEVHPVCDLNWNDEEEGLRPFRGDPERETHCEQCQPHEAHFWSVYGHLKEGGLECFEDFATREEAETFAEKLQSVYPHLR